MLEQGKTLYVGLDLCDECSQLCCYNEKIKEPVPIEKEVGKPLIPTVLGISRDGGEWFYGEDAVLLGKKGEALLIEGFISKIECGETIELGGSVFTKVQIMERFLRKILSLLKSYYPNDTIKGLVITIARMNVVLIKAIYRSLEKMGIGRERVRIISHEQAYLYYALSQKKELWVNDIGLFDFDEKGLSYQQITINRRNLPMVAGVSRKDFKETLSYEFLQEQGEKGAVNYVFENIAKSVLHKQVISTLYLTGKGFAGEWFREVIKELGGGRRLFVGQNLYTGGACHAAREISLREEGLKSPLQEFIFLTGEMVPCSISVKAYCNAKIEELTLIQAGMPWYEADRRIYLIPDYEDELEITVRDVMRHTVASYLLNLGEVTGRPNKTIRLEVRVYFPEADTCILKVKDRGFGELFPTSNRVWEKTIRIQGVL